MGKSGCGKSTLLYILSTMDTDYDGELYLNNKLISGEDRDHLSYLRNKHIGFVFQAYNLIPVLTAKENIEFIMVLQNRDAKTMQERSDDLLDRMGIKDQRDRRPSELSGGQQQRVAVALHIERDFAEMDGTLFLIPDHVVSSGVAIAGVTGRTDVH